MNKKNVVDCDWVMPVCKNCDVIYSPIITGGECDHYDSYYTTNCSNPKVDLKNDEGEAKTCGHFYEGMVCVEFICTHIHRCKRAYEIGVENEKSLCK